ncbi:NAD(P)H quinone oxidoreductase, PIG3 family [Radiomyces spectabilis]|uniref:NAD(P)H quinone oxidoreductase, PIG3 family n=1 Tax=Radiomyces spectabilis TaxID=64574 RepID=UPI00221FC5C8|nr:NAD(P)H quinone oxidoreductase, PIG3 family [Radiomyces spectabilis]KAI8373079.1 NAD(P)H quinone oxidoreductase, PIG3 family [Radiomyces spectabilis]
MKAVLVKQPGDASQLCMGDYPTPVIKDTELLVKVHCFCLNRMDIVQRQGRYPPPPGASPLLGVEMSGIVEEVGSKVTKFKKGDAVFGLMPGGAYAEYAAIDERLAICKPDSLSFEEAAAIPETWFTAYQALFFVGNLEPGMDVLIHAGASGVGIAAIQLAKHAGAKRIFITAGSDEKLEFCKSLGATTAINYKTQDWAEVIAKETDNKGVNVIVDFIGKNYWQQNLQTLAVDGHMVILAFMSGNIVDQVDLSMLLRKRLRIEGSALRSRSIDYQSRLRDAVFEKVIKELKSDKCAFKVFLDKEFDWKDIQEAHRYMESNQSQGKIVVKVTQ